MYQDDNRSWCYDRPYYREQYNGDWEEAPWDRGGYYEENRNDRYRMSDQYDYQNQRENYENYKRNDDYRRDDSSYWCYDRPLKKHCHKECEKPWEHWKKPDPCDCHEPCKHDPCDKWDPCKHDHHDKWDPCKHDHHDKWDPCKHDHHDKCDPCKHDHHDKWDPCKHDHHDKWDPCKHDHHDKWDPCKKCDPCCEPCECCEPCFCCEDCDHDFKKDKKNGGININTSVNVCQNGEANGGDANGGAGGKAVGGSAAAAAAVADLVENGTVDQNALLQALLELEGAAGLGGLAVGGTGGNGGTAGAGGSVSNSAVVTVVDVIVFVDSANNILDGIEPVSLDLNGRKVDIRLTDNGETFVNGEKLAEQQLENGTKVYIFKNTETQESQE
ncbi:hypothetical protein KCX82_14985 [Clostridiales bacterium BAD-6]|uniref:Uncharacterized protein n=1 Tax=Sinanaerobacter chloroacetimidivorans TaxID=2818044 RepID=A0A8J7W4Z6_9FIRM|nr:hypothetical protein [Sinanaerobacter chloroacetimidivorans]